MNLKYSRCYTAFRELQKFRNHTSVYLRGHSLKKDFQACVYNLRSFAPIRWNDKAMLSIMRFHGRFAINVLDLHTNPCG